MRSHLPAVLRHLLIIAVVLTMGACSTEDPEVAGADYEQPSRTTPSQASWDLTDGTRLTADFAVGEQGGLTIERKFDPADQCPLDSVSLQFTRNGEPVSAWQPTSEDATEGSQTFTLHFSTRERIEINIKLESSDPDIPNALVWTPSLTP